MYKYYFGISATFRNERNYLIEWIEFHKKVGAQVIFLYDDRSDDNPKEVLQKYIDSGYVIYHTADKYKLRFPHIKRVASDYSKLCKWVAFIDIDEFLYPSSKIKKENIINILKEFDQENIKAIYVNWLCFGSNNLEKYEDKLIVDRFTKRSDKLFGINCEVKSIVQPSIINRVTNSHIFELKDNNVYYNDRKENNKLGARTRSLELGFNKNIASYFKIYGHDISLDNLGRMSNKQYPPSYRRLCINHYITKSKEEYMNKQDRYDNKRNDRYNMKVFNNLNKYLNMIEDDSIKKI